jgi:Fe-S cluster assembly iron-binding protein IscA
MFSYTDTAAALIQSLVSSPEGSSGSGLRFSVDPSWGSLKMELARGPDAGDQIFSHRHTNVFVAEDAAARLEKQVLDARIDKERAAFFLVDRKAGQRW